MKKYNAVCWLIFCVIAASCSYSTIVPTNNWDAARITQSSLPSPNHSFGPRWEMVDQSIYIGENLSIVVYAIKLTGQSTVVFSSVVSDEDRLNQPDFSIMLQDNVGDANLMSKKNFYSLGNIRFWVLKFEARNLGASEISMVLGQNNTISSITQIAKFVEPPEDPAIIGGRTYMIGAGQVFEQEGYQITFEGWIPPSLSVKSSTVYPTEGVTIIDKATFRIESLLSGKIDYLYIQLLSNGEITSELIQ